MTDIYHEAPFVAPKIFVDKDCGEVLFIFGDDCVSVSEVSDPASFLTGVKKEIERALGETSS